MKTKQMLSPALSRALGLGELYIKREDEHKYGSHKGRSIPLMLKDGVKNGRTHFVISSSGNAALAAILGTIAHNQNNPAKSITLTVYVGEHIDPSKYEMLQKAARGFEASIVLSQVERPKQSAMQDEKEKNAYYLRQSTNDVALLGYEELGEELGKIEHLSAVFVPTSSGTTAQGIGNYFDKNGIKAEVHIVQTTSCHPMAELFDTDFAKTEDSIAGAIVDLVAHRKEAVVNAIKKSNGSGWIVSDDDIRNAQTLLKNEAKIEVTLNGALALAGLTKAVKKGKKWDGTVAILICGK